MSSVPDYIGLFIDTNIRTLRDIYDAGCSAEQEGLLMIEIDVDKNDSQVYFTGKQRLADMDKLDFYNDIRKNIKEENKDDIILYIMDRKVNKVHLLIVKKPT